jgi:hypothetical protein
MADELGQDDYQQLYGMLTSGDESMRSQGQSLAAKLTPSEASTFAAFQKTQHAANPDIHRVDNQILGLPPELAAIGVAKVAAPMAQAGLSATGRMVAGAKAATEQVAPILKFEAANRGMQALGIPAPIAEVLAYTLAGATGKPSRPSAAGARNGAKAAEKAAENVAKQKITTMGAGSTAPVAADTAAAASTVPPPVAAPTPAPVATPSAPAIGDMATVGPRAVKGPQQALNELAIQARRMGVKLTEEESQQLKPLVQTGTDPAAAIKSLKSDSDPAAEFAAHFGTPSAEDVQNDFKSRWEKGKIKDYAGRKK